MGERGGTQRVRGKGVVHWDMVLCPHTHTCFVVLWLSVAAVKLGYSGLLLLQVAHDVHDYADVAEFHFHL